MKKSIKRIVSLCIVIIMCLGFTSFAGESIADNASNINTNNDISNDESGTIENPDILIEDFTRGTEVPTKFKNLSAGAYAVSGTYKVYLNTNYYFAPDSFGTLTVNVTTTWPSQYVLQKKMVVSVKSVKTNKVVKSATVYTTYNSSTELYSKEAILSKTFTGLDPDKSYYIMFEKTNDTYSATLSGTISW